MSFEQILDSFNHLENSEREKFLDYLYDHYFDTGLTQQQREEFSNIIEAYLEGKLIEVETDDY
jgi:uncharacterized protein YbgA (DUF1722 family)